MYLKTSSIIKLLKHQTLVFSLLVIFPVFSSHGQANFEVKIITVAREIITSAEICTLITQDKEGNARARAMDAFLPDENFIVWFGTNPKSRKIAQIQKNKKVTLYYFDKPSASYVSILGRAEVIYDAAMLLKYWKREWSEFYPNYPENYALIKVTPVAMEVVSESRGIRGDSITWQPQTIYFKN